MGATVTLQDRPGYCPMHDDEAMNEVALAAMKRIVSEDEILIQTHWGTGCTDMGDLSAVLPTTPGRLERIDRGLSWQGFPDCRRR